MDTCNVFKWERKAGTRWEGSANIRGHLGCSITLIGHHIWVLGGIGNSGNMCVLDLTNDTWSKLSITLPRDDAITMFSHSANLFEDGIFLYGVQCNLTESNNLYVLDPVLNEVRLQHTYGGPPREQSNKWRPADICEALDLFVFCSPSPLDETVPVLLDLNTWTWARPRVKAECPLPLLDTSACVVGKMLYVYGRSSDFFEGFRSFMYLLDLQRYHLNDLSWSRVPVDGAGSARRRGAGMVSLGRNRLFIFGGSSREGVTNDILIAEDLASNVVTSRKVVQRWLVHPFPSGGKVVYSGNLPFPGDWPRLVVAQDKLYVFGCRSYVNWDYYEVTPKFLE